LSTGEFQKQILQIGWAVQAPNVRPSLQGHQQWLSFGGVKKHGFATHLNTRGMLPERRVFGRQSQGTLTIQFHHIRL
jgi:hypothetical protein